MKKYKIRKWPYGWSLWLYDEDYGRYYRISSWLGSHEQAIRIMDYRESLQRAD